MIRLLAQITCDMCQQTVMTAAARVDTAAAIRSYAEDQAAKLGWATLDRADAFRHLCYGCATKQAHIAAKKAAEKPVERPAVRPHP